MSDVDTTAPQMKPGDLCILLGDDLVEHVNCTEHPPGTVTNVRTGESLNRPRKD